MAIEDWQYEVKNGDTKLGYHEWLLHKVESEAGDELASGIEEQLEFDFGEGF